MYLNIVFKIINATICCFIHFLLVFLMSNFVVRKYNGSYWVAIMPPIQWNLLLSLMNRKKKSKPISSSHWGFKVLLNDTHRERLMFHSIQYMNGWLAASDLFDMLTQSIKLYTFHYQYRRLKNVIHQVDSKNGWLLLSASFAAEFG